MRLMYFSDIFHSEEALLTFGRGCSRPVTNHVYRCLLLLLFYFVILILCLNPAGVI